jgi:hypothetical protein
MVRFDDLVVERFELTHDAAVEHDRRATRCARARERVAETARRAGDQDDALREINVQWIRWRGEWHGGSAKTRNCVIPANAGIRCLSGRYLAKIDRALPDQGLSGYTFRFAVGV